MFPFVSAIASIGGIIVSKITLTRRQVSQRDFVPVLFLFLFLLTLLLFPFLGKISPDIFKPYYLIILVLMIATATLENIFYYRGMQAEKMQEFELIIMSQPLLTIILASIFLKGEQNLPIIIVSIIAALSLIFAHLNKKHLAFSNGSRNLIFAVILTSVELIFIKILLNVMSPVALYTVRTAILFIFFFFYFKPQISKICNTNIALILGAAFFGSLGMVTQYYGFYKYGVVYTSLILILAPLLIYIISTIFLHEKIKPRMVACGLVILGCILYTTLLGNK